MFNGKSGNTYTHTHTQIHLQRMMALSVVLGVYTTWTKYVKLHLMLQQLLPKKVTQSFTAEKQHRGPRWVLVASCLASNCALPRRPSSSGRVENVDCNSKSPPTTPWTSVTSSWKTPCIYFLLPGKGSKRQCDDTKLIYESSKLWSDEIKWTLWKSMNPRGKTILPMVLMLIFTMLSPKNLQKSLRHCNIWLKVPIETVTVTYMPALNVSQFQTGI